MIQPQLGKTRHPVVGLAVFGRNFAGPWTVRPTVCGGGLKAAEGVEMDGQRGDVVSEVQLAQTETVEGERMHETQSIVTQIEVTKSPQMT